MTPDKVLRKDDTMQDIKKFFNTYNKQRSRYDAISPLQVLFEFYSHRSPPESQELLNLRAHVEELTSHLPYAEQDAFLCAVNELCAEQERYAVMEGICLGARTLLALTELDS